MTEQTRRKVTETRRLDIDYCFIDKAIEELTEARVDGFTRVEIEVERGYYDSCSAVVTVTKEREENDDEFNDRIQREQSLRNYRRLEYERLKKEFGGA